MVLNTNDFIHKTVLDNGLTVISETIKTVRSVSVGIFVKSGSRYEMPSETGLAHFLEHMLFKGSRNLDALQIVQSIEEVGGSINAYTSKEYSLFYLRILDTNLKTALNVLSEIICRPVFKSNDIELEKQIVTEEIRAAKDTPDDYIFDLFHEKIFPGHSMGNPILGTESSINTFSEKSIKKFWDRHFSAGNIIISAAGNVDHQQLLDMIDEVFVFDIPNLPVNNQVKPGAAVFQESIRESVAQAHICCGLESFPHHEDKTFSLLALNTYLGAGMSSRLFQQIREKYGLAYTVYSMIESFSDCGLIEFYLGTDDKQAYRAIELLVSELERLAKNEITGEALQKIKSNLTGSLLLGLEHMDSRMSRLAKNELYFGKQISIEKAVQKIESISTKSLLEISENLFNMDKFNYIILKPE